MYTVFKSSADRDIGLNIVSTQENLKLPCEGEIEFLGIVDNYKKYLVTPGNTSKYITLIWGDIQGYFGATVLEIINTGRHYLNLVVMDQVAVIQKDNALQTYAYNIHTPTTPAQILDMLGEYYANTGKY